MGVRQLDTGTSEPYKNLVKQDYDTDFLVRRSDYEGDIHDSLIEAMEYISEDELEEIFGIRNFNRLLGEGYEMEGSLEVEDWAITGSCQGGEIAVGQTVSCDGKEVIPGTKIPRDFHQAIKFGERVEEELGMNVTGFYVVRTCYEPEEVRRHRERIDENIDFFGFESIDVEIYELESEEKEGIWRQV
ncbi:MAG: hypothetical protein H8Z69_01265 [Nanohaloarchaea archaeon]|nr:hypothetical protein [Candidatus Nanohaloarchaea archaeon]